jgi:hypothetical protein
MHVDSLDSYSCLSRQSFLSQMKAIPDNQQRTNINFCL